jgi:hypothetical protein
MESIWSSYMLPGNEKSSKTHYPNRDKGRLAEPPFVVAGVSHSIPTDHKLG